MTLLSILLEVAARATLIAAGTALVLLALRIHSATVRHTAWTAVVIAMLCLPIWLAAGVRVPLPVLTPATGEIAADRNVSDFTAAMTGSLSDTRALDAPTPSSPISRSPAAQATFEWQSALVSLYLAATLVLLLRLMVGTLQTNRLRRHAVMQDGRLTSSRCVTPITVGWFKPALILPDGWHHWPTAKLDAVLTHEREHARRRDPLVQWVALLNRAVFWFHPLAWWLERRLSFLAEEACDGAVLAAGHSPQEYSEYLLEMARSVSKDGGRLHVVGMAMPGTGLAQRVRLLFLGLPAARTSRTRVVCTLVFCAMSSALFASGSLAERARDPRPAQVPIDKRTANGAIVSNPTDNLPRQSPAAARSTGLLQAQAPSQTQPVAGMQIKFDVVSIKPCLSQQPTGRGSNAIRGRTSPGYAYWACESLAELVELAWGGFFPANELLNTIKVPPNLRLDLPSRIRGGPSWAAEDRFTIEVTLSGDTTDLTGSARVHAVHAAMKPALRAMLEDRFQLKLRKMTEQRPMYALTVAPGGLKITQTAPQRCWQIPPGTRTKIEPPPGFEGTLSCAYGMQGRRPNGNTLTEFTNINLKDFAKELSEIMDRYVLDRTGVEGRFSFKLEYAPDDTTPGTTEIADVFARARADLAGQPAPQPVKGFGPTIFKALEALGLKLDRTTGPAEYLLIENAQRPKPNVQMP